MVTRCRLNKEKMHTTREKDASFVKLGFVLTVEWISRDWRMSFR